MPDPNDNEGFIVVPFGQNTEVEEFQIEMMPLAQLLIGPDPNFREGLCAWVLVNKRN